MTKVHDEDAIEIGAALDEVRVLTDQIGQAMDATEELLDRRMSAIRRLTDAADRHAVLVGDGMARAAMASGRTPPFMSELVLLAVHEAADGGATLPYIGAKLHQRLGRRIDPSLIVATLRKLALGKEVVDRSTRFYAPGTSLAGGRVGSEAPTIKSLVVEALENDHGAGLGGAAIRDAIEKRHGRTIALSSLNPVLRQLERAQRVVHVGRKWALSEHAQQVASID